ISQRADRTVGDSLLKEFAGTLMQFGSKASIDTLIASAGSADVAILAKNLDLTNKIATHDVVGQFLTNMDLDANGSNFLKNVSNITFVGKTELKTTYISDARDVPQYALASFDIQGFQATQYIVDTGTKAVIAPIKATELVGLE